MFGAEQSNQCGKLAFAPARKIVMAEQRRRVGPQAQGFGQRIARLGMALHQFFERRVQRRQRIVDGGVRVRGTELHCLLTLELHRVDGGNDAGAGQLRALDGVAADATAADDCHGVARLNPNR